MSATDFVLFAADDNRPFGWKALYSRWWTRLRARCAGPACPRDGKLWSSWVHRTAGVELEHRWYCSRGCLEAVLVSRVHALLSGFQAEKPRAYRIPLGLLLVQRGVISSHQLREALRHQRETGQGRIGDWLRQTAQVSVAQLTAALGQQWGCPVFPLEAQTESAFWSDLIPLPLLESAAAVPAHASPGSGVLHIAFGERVDHTLLYAVEQMLQCRTFPCIAPASAVQIRLERFRKLTSGNNISFDTVRDPAEMTWTICNYVMQLQPLRIALTRAASYIWVRFFRAGSTRDLLFRLSLDHHRTILERLSESVKALEPTADDRKGGVSDASLSL